MSWGKSFYISRAVSYLYYTTDTFGPDRVLIWINTFTTSNSKMSNWPNGWHICLRFRQPIMVGSVSDDSGYAVQDVNRWSNFKHAQISNHVSEKFLTARLLSKWLWSWVSHEYERIIGGTSLFGDVILTLSNMMHFGWNPFPGRTYFKALMISCPLEFSWWPNWFVGNAKITNLSPYFSQSSFICVKSRTVVPKIKWESFRIGKKVPKIVPKIDPKIVPIIVPEIGGQNCP